jgi:hypothetical protein
MEELRYHSHHQEPVFIGYEADQSDESSSVDDDDDDDSLFVRPSCGMSAPQSYRRQKRKRLDIDLSSVSHTTSRQWREGAPLTSSVVQVPWQEVPEQLHMNNVRPPVDHHFAMRQQQRRLTTSTALSFLSNGSLFQQGGGGGVSRPALFLSTKTFGMEEALSLSASAHLIIEATPPHRVIHANAAFHHMLTFQQPSSLRTTTSFSNNNLRHNSVNHHAQVRSMFGNNRTVTLYPIVDSAVATEGGEQPAPRHYLVELSSETSLFGESERTMDQKAQVVA